ncbi:MAG: gamma-glutamyl-gamma-aminobutyrate hydrolase family protein [Planctomycetes bacterium]|nr:gamma-glutamyl-gamma-aminobutyrate hydrolase family protein [Planctomycetota bacterium]
MNKPLIGICIDHVRHFPRPDRDRSYLKLYPTYPNAIIAAGGTPLVIPIVPDVNDVRALLSIVQGVVLVGGDDYPAEWFGKTTLPTDAPVTPERANFDREFTRLLYEETDLPVLGVCGGMQMTAIWGGGSLIQHLGEGVHRDGKEGFSRHAISVTPDSVFARAIGATEIEVNSQHHQAVESVGPEMRVCATAPDGVAEAIEFKNHPFRIGVQWHPERMTGDPHMRSLFETFVAVAAARLNVVA